MVGFSILLRDRERQRERERERERQRQTGRDRQRNREKRKRERERERERKDGEREQIGKEINRKIQRKAAKDRNISKKCVRDGCLSSLTHTLPNKQRTIVLVDGPARQASIMPECCPYLFRKGHAVKKGRQCNFPAKLF